LLIIIFAILFASQTITAAFDSHSAHQEIDASQNLSHRNLDESHNTHPEGALASIHNAADSSTQEQFDCHHCCHCHAPASVYIADNERSNVIHKSNDNVLMVKVALLSLWITPEHRPPIV
tara:strand:+ start:544 stop:903 length:360 start_codon:yes stop_codon:yes gene_type:complete